VYGDKVRIVWKHFPLDFHPNAMPAAIASMAAAEQGKFWEFHDKVFAAQNKMSLDQYLQYAKDLHLDVKKFQEAITTARGKAVIDADSNEGKALGVTGTPAFFVNGKFLSGAKPFNEFATVINAELTRLKIPIPSGAAQAGG
jgi:protein-disulfide isomerase